jgi:phosphatidylglycerol:prolipoprotein diacylglycerol transferase
VFPILFSWGPILLPAWHTFYVLGAIATFIIMLKLARAYHPEVPERSISRLFVICYVAGYFGARLLSIFVEESQTKGLLATLTALLQFGAMTFYGGAIAAFAAGYAYVKLAKLSLADMIDLSLPAGLAALSLGRIGCFLNGDDYGLPVPLAAGQAAPFWAVTFPNLKDGVARYPVQLYEAIAVGALVVALIALYPRIRAALKPGAVGFLAVVAYANLRFGLEFLRGDFRGSVLVDWLSTSQFISICVLAVAGLCVPFWLARKAAPA